jgi:acetaldehyde dehydrogenase (acetylating)
MIGFIAAAAVIAATAAIVEAMLAPAVAVAPAGPGTYAQEDAVEEESRPVKAIGRAFVGWVFVVAKFAHRRHADFDVNLSASRWNKDQPCNQCCRTEENFESAHM